MNLDIIDVKNIISIKEGSYIVKTRESKKVEYKLSFDWNNREKYSKTMAAFANCIGGFIIFGIKDKPHELVGIDDQIDRIDEAKISQYLNDIFEPEIIWSKQTLEIESKKIGIIYVEQSMNKPIISKKNQGDIREGEIYYRYNARSERIKYAELTRIIEFEREKEREKWISTLKKVSDIGPNNLGLIDLKSGILSLENRPLLIDSEIASQLKFIKEGQFNEKKGARTLKLIGQIQEVSGGSTQSIELVETVKELDIFTIYKFVFKRLEPNNVLPDAILRIFVLDGSIYAPINYLMKTFSLDVNSFSEMLSKIKTTKKSIIKKLIERVNLKRDFSKVSKIEESQLVGFVSRKSEEINSLFSMSKTVKIRTIVWSLILEKEFELVMLIEKKYHKEVLESLTHLPKEFVDENISNIFDIIERIYETNFNSVGNSVKQAVAYIDQCLYT